MYVLPLPFSAPTYYGSKRSERHLLLRNNEVKCSFVCVYVCVTTTATECFQPFRPTLHTGSCTLVLGQGC